jgi:hypothetical protein
MSHEKEKKKKKGNDHINDHICCGCILLTFQVYIMKYTRSFKRWTVKHLNNMFIQGMQGEKSLD